MASPNSLTTRPVFLLGDTLEHGGAEAIVLHLARALHAEGIPVYAVSVRLGGPLLHTYVREGIACMVLGNVRRRGGLAVLQELVRMFRAHKPGIVHTHLMIAGLFGRIAAVTAGVPVVIHTQHNTLDDDSRSVQATEALLDRFSACVVGISQAVRDELARGHRAPRRTLTCIYNGVDAAALSHVAPLTETRLGRRIAIVGRLRPQKGHSVVLDALARLRARNIAATLEVYGEGELEASLRAHVARLALDDAVTFHGMVTDRIAIYARTDVVAAPSRWEGFGLVVAEAMAAARPVVASRVGGIPEIVADGETGLLVPPENPAALADALARVLTDPPRARAMGIAGRMRTNALFNVERMTTEYMQLYATLLRQRGLPWPGTPVMPHGS